MAKSKLVRVNVPELFYGRFLANLAQTTTLLQKLALQTPTARGRGMSRVLPEITEAEWEELYQHAAEARAQMQGADRQTTLRPAICARALAERMEALGVASPVVYTPKRTKRVVAEAPVVDTAEVDTDLSSRLPSTPPTVDQVADVDEVSAEDLAIINNDIAAQ